MDCNTTTHQAIVKNDTSLLHYPDGIVYKAYGGYAITTGFLIVCISHVIIATMIIFLNSIVCHAFLKYHHNVDLPEYCVISLSVTDLVTGVILLYHVSNMLGNYQIVEECLVRLGLGQSVGISSFWHLCILVLDRYIKITRPLHYPKWLSKTSIILISISIWVGCIGFGLLPLLGWTTINIHQDEFCWFFEVLSKEYLTVSMSLALGPIFAMIYMYAVIFKVARQQAKAIGNNVLPRHQHAYQSQLRQTIRLVKTVFIMIGVSVLCLIPMAIVYILHISDTPKGMTREQKGKLMMYSSGIVFLNSLINPIIYAVKIPMVKRQFYKVCCWFKHRRGLRPNVIEIQLTESAQSTG
ncbi:hypothetical protein ACJMK2_036178 [Sinanodonta woodiana]|uniref:G-protein coupled receptors family 1 profile domain-containing protein n=1 Tax=Sinanodonta woodiana TaxID=1069815 RepID=A0ABD3WHJ6_SINWO